VTAAGGPQAGGEQSRAIACDSCGANLPVVLDADAIGCTHCGAEHAVSGADRELMRSVAAELRETDALSNAAEGIRAKLLKPTLAVLFGDWVGAIMLVLWIMLGWALGAAMGEFFHRPAIFARGGVYVLSTFVLYLPVIAACFTVFAIWKARNLRAFRTAAAALPPLAGGSGVRCRTCGSDLGQGSDRRAFVVCEHCQTQNLIGLDEVRRREQLTREQGAQKLEALRTTQTRLGNRLTVLVLSLVVMPIALGILLNPLQNRVLIALFPLLPAPPEPRAWVEQPAQLALEVPPDPRQPWPIVFVGSKQVSRQLTVLHLGQVRKVDPYAGYGLRQLPLKMGLRVVDLTRPDRGMGIVSDGWGLLFPDGAYSDSEGHVRGISLDRWTQMAVLPQWGTAAEYDEYFSWDQPEIEPADAMRLVIADPAELREPSFAWATSVELFSSQYKTAGWNAEQVLGIPDVYPRHADDQRAWAPAGKDGAAEWIVVRFEPPVRARSVVIVETFNPGAVARIDDFTSNAWLDPIWIGTVPPEQRSRVLVLPLTTPRVIGALRVTLDPRRAAGWNEIDGIGLVRAQ
jgi:hypothetical protein